MFRKVLNSFIPYITILIGIFVIVIFLDAYAEKISDEPEIINIAASSSDEKESIVNYETDDVIFSGSENTIQSDSVFIQAVRLYRKKHFNQAKKNGLAFC